MSDTTERTDRRRLQVRSAAKARNAALRDLGHRYPDEYRVLYERYAIENGVLPNSMREARLEELRDSA